MSEFLSPLRVEYVEPWDFPNNGTWNENDGTARWQLTEPLLYYSSLLKRMVEVPTGFRNDLASVPTLPLIYARYGNRYARPAAVHDFLCRRIGERIVPRAKCDKVFLEAMRVENAMEIDAMIRSGVDPDRIAERKLELDALAREMYAAVYLYSASGRWKNETDEPGFNPIG